MQRHDHPVQPANPYPDTGSVIADFAFASALVLVRPIGSVPTRRSEDANYILGRDFLCDWRPKGEAWRRIAVPAGLITDLTSVPWLLRGVVSRVGPWLEAAILHDYLYIAWQDVPGRGARPADRRFADDIMLAAMRANRVDALRARLIHLSVRRFGASGYRSPTAQRYADLDALRRQLAFTVPRM